MADISKIKIPGGNIYNIDAVTVNGHSVDSDVPKNATFTQPDLSPYMKTHSSIPLQDNASTIATVRQNNVVVSGDYALKPTSDERVSRFYRTYSPDASNYIEMRVNTTKTEASVLFQGTLPVTEFSVSGKPVAFKDEIVKSYVTGEFTISANGSVNIPLGFKPSFVDVRGKDTGYEVLVTAKINNNGFVATGLNNLSNNVPVSYIAFR